MMKKDKESSLSTIIFPLMLNPLYNFYLFLFINYLNSFYMNKLILTLRRKQNKEVESSNNLFLTWFSSSVPEALLDNTNLSSLLLPALK